MNETEEDDDSRGSESENYENSEDSQSQEDSNNKNMIDMYNIVCEKFNSVTINTKNYDKIIVSLKEIFANSSVVRENINRIYFNAETQTENEANRNSVDHLNEITTITEEETEEEKEIRRLNEEIEYIKSEQKKELCIKNDQLVSYEEKIKEYELIINKIQIENGNLRQYQDKNELMKLQQEKKRNVNKIVLSSRHTITIISSYLSNEELMIFSQSSKKLYNCLFHQVKNTMVKMKFIQRKQIIETMIAPETSLKYDVSEKKIEELIEKYITNASVPGKDLRNRITNSLLFIEKKIREPLRELYEESNNIKGNDKNDKKFLFKKTFTSFVSAIKGDNDSKYEDTITNDHQNCYMILPKENLKDIDENDKELLKLFENNKQLNIKFEFTSHNQIKELLEHFLQSNLQKSSYAKFLPILIEQYAKLLFACHISLKEIKEIQIVNHAINSRFRKYKFECAKMQVELNDLHKLRETSTIIKNTIQMQKTELEIKYNITLTEISRLITEKGKIEKRIKQMSDEMAKNKNSYEELKDKLVTDYKLIQNDYKKTKIEKEMFYNLLLNFQKFFMNYVMQDGEIN